VRPVHGQKHEQNQKLERRLILAALAAERIAPAALAKMVLLKLVNGSALALLQPKEPDPSPSLW
jgi:hypothetical protein